MTDVRRVGGWHRLWIVLSAIYFVLVLVIAGVLFPESKPGISQEERLKRSSDLVAQFLKANPDFAKQPPILPSEYGGRPVDRSKFPDEVARLHAKYRGRVDFSSIEDAVAPSNTVERLRYIGVAFLTWLVPVVVLYVLGLAVRWVFKGFTEH
jgi:hypothetical protein